jgi:hypothetical protein
MSLRRGSQEQRAWVSFVMDRIGVPEIILRDVLFNGAFEKDL